VSSHEDLPPRATRARPAGVTLQPDDRVQTVQVTLHGDEAYHDGGRTLLSGGSYLNDAAWRARLLLPFKSARGCWWGQKQRCPVCDLNGEGMSYRPAPLSAPCRSCVSWPPGARS
jgi:hypothetical protein